MYRTWLQETEAQRNTLTNQLDALRRAQADSITKALSLKPTARIGVMHQVKMPAKRDPCIT